MNISTLFRVIYHYSNMLYMPTRRNITKRKISDLVKMSFPEYINEQYLYLKKIVLSTSTIMIALEIHTEHIFSLIFHSNKIQ